MAITRREALEIVDFVMRELNKRLYPSMTDGRLDLTKTTGGTVSGTADYGGSIAGGAIYDRQVHPNADIIGTKIRIATTTERGTVELAEYGETASGLAVQSDDPRLYTISGAGNVYVTESGMIRTISGSDSFLTLTDTPDTYSGGAYKVVTVKSGEDGLEFTNLSGVYLPYSAFDGFYKITVGTEEPVSPMSGDLWIDTNT
jgi:hypothetical protein